MGKVKGERQEKREGGGRGGRKKGGGRGGRKEGGGRGDIGERSSEIFEVISIGSV